LPETIQNVILTYFFACHTNRVNNKLMPATTTTTTTTQQQLEEDEAEAEEMR